MIELPKAEYKREWGVCPHCGNKNKSFLITNNAVCYGVYTVCKKCKKEYEIRIDQGAQGRVPQTR